MQNNKFILIGIGLVIIFVLFNLDFENKDQLVSQIEVIDYDSNGNIIQREVVLLSIKEYDLLQATITIPSEFEGNYIQKQLPNAPADTATRQLTLIIQNTGNIDTNMEIKNAKLVEDYLT